MKKTLTLFLSSVLFSACAHQSVVGTSGRLPVFDKENEEPPQTLQAVESTRSPDQDGRDDSLTEAWRDNVGISRHSILEGYPEKISYAPGETLKLMVNAVGTDFELSIARYGLTVETVVQQVALQEFHQVTPPQAYKVGCKWKPAFTMKIPQDWRAGFYYVRLQPKNRQVRKFSFPFVVRGGGQSVPAKIAVLASSNTWSAYNFWGGASVYKDFRGNPKLPRNTFVNNSRPNYNNFPDGQYSNEAETEIFALQWLEAHHYDFDLYSDFDLHTDPGLLSKYRVVVINGHSEYWSKEMYDGVENFVNDGGNLVSLSANEIYAKVTFKGDMMETYRAYSDGGTHTQTGEPGGLWSQHLKRYESGLLGTRYFSPPAATAGPYKVLKSSHWAFEGTNVADGDLIGKGGKINRYGVGASGWETDRVDPENSPANIEILAEGQHFNGAHIAYYKRAGQSGNGGEVFTVGSLTFSGSFADDPVLSRMMQNVFDRFTQK